MTDSPDADEVDLIVGAWNRERPDLDVEPLHVLSRISRLSRLLDQARRKAFAQHDLDAWEFDVLSALRRAGNPYELSPGQLIQQTLVTSGTMTNRVDRLTERGLVERHPSLADRRGILVRLTHPGREVVDGAMADLIAQEHLLIDSLSVTEQKQLAGLLRTLLGSVEPG
jgi:DNA-binding MarR family transcriptional regulator